ncbi:radical SAM protein [Methylobacterium terricola]|nr:radical SAM protein [Methylobacterium terricola]
MARKSLQYVVKLSKYCNLRCSYCYEFESLGDKKRMSPELLEAIFTHARDFARDEELARIRFSWHGGEPFMVPVEQYRQIGALQRRVFDGKIPIQNVAQTNLTILPEKLLDFLKHGDFFQGIGISFDVQGDQRIDRQGLPSAQKTLDNLQTIIDHEIDFGAITVLARNTISHVEAIFNFYDRLGIPFRLLPFYLSAYDEQIEQHAITQGELVEAMKLTFDLWMMSDNPLSIDPLDDYIDHAVDFLTGNKQFIYNKDADEIVFIIDIDGSVSGMADTYDPVRTYGNLGTMTMHDIIVSPGRRIALDECQSRMARHCNNCPYYGYCPGHFVAEATPAQRPAMVVHGCPARAVIDHIVERLSGFDDLSAILPAVRRCRTADASQHRPVY